MKHIFLFLLALAPALAFAQTGTVKDSVRVLTTAEISAVNTPNDTTHVYFIQDGSWKKIRMDSLARFARVKLIGDRGDITVSGADGLTWSVDNGAITGAKLATNAVDLAATTVTGTLPVNKGGTNTTTLAQSKVLVGNGTSGVLTPTNLHWDNSNSFLGVGETNLTTSPNNVFRLTVKGAFPALFNTESTANTLTYGGTRYARSTSTLNNGNGFQFSFNNANNLLTEYGYYGAYIIDNTVDSVDGGFIFAPTFNGVRTERLRLLSNGRLGIGETAPTEILHVVGNARITGLNGVNDVGASATGVLQAATSDINLKNSILPIEYGLSEILKLQPVSFLYNDTNRKLDSDVPDLGFIAQDVFQVIPNAVSSTGESVLQLDYKAITATLVKAIQEQQAQIEQLKNRIIQLENK